MLSSKKHVIKFGGSSLQTTALFNQSANIVVDRIQTAHPYVVVSAIGGVTESLIQLTKSYPDNSEEAVAKVEKLEKLHQQYFDELISSSHPQRGNLQDLFGELRNTLTDQKLQNQNLSVWKNRILSIGERASAIIFASLLSTKGLPAEAFEAQHFIKTDSTFSPASVNHHQTQKLVRNFFKSTNIVPVITGFIASNSANQITTLGRSGSDYSAGLIAGALDADHLEIWTDVDGVLTADPKWVPTAKPIEQLSFNDIAELSAHGAKVIHPQTIQPLRDKNTSVLVKNSHNPSHPGTLITSDYKSNGTLKTITLSGPYVRLQIEEQHAFNLLSALDKWRSDNLPSGDIDFKHPSKYEPAQFLIRQAWFEQISDQLAQWAADRSMVLDLKDNLYKIKKFSNHFGDNGRLSKQIWNLLNANQLQPISTDQNNSKLFISFLFERDDAQRAARLMNDYLQDDRTVVDLFVAGTGAVGETLLKKLRETEPKGIRFRLLGVCNSRNTLWDERGLGFNSELDWTQSENTNWDKLTTKLTQPYRHNLIFVDATGSEEVARLYPQLFSSGIHVVTPSKLANTFEQSFFDELQSLIKKHNTSFCYETTVGAGLPVISTINDLKSSGDRIREITGVVSGTMTYLFNQIEQGVPFSKAIVDARKKGYAEPDPRDDLSGEDVARKFLTLARTLGLKIEREELQVESLIPENLKDVDKKTFLEGLPKYDDVWKQRIQDARQQNETLRYTGQLKDTSIKIGVQLVSKDSPLGQLERTDNLIQIFSELYNQTPLVIQGAGAGKEITASGVLGDILKTAKSLS